MSSEHNPELRELLGTYSRVVAIAFEGVQVMTTKVVEALEDGDPQHARELARVLEQNIDHWRNTFVL